MDLLREYEETVDGRLYVVKEFSRDGETVSHLVKSQKPDPDTRVQLSLSIDKAEMAADGVDKATVTVQALDSAGDPVAYSANVKLWVHGLGIAKVTLIDGAGTYDFKTLSSGRYVVEADDAQDYRPANSLTVDALL